LVRARSVKHVIKDWDGLARETMRQPDVSSIPTVSVGDVTSPAVARLGLSGSSVVDCLPVDAEVALPQLCRDKKAHSDTRSLGNIAPQLFNMEPRSQQEKPLSIDLNLYQMENF
jgi:hypothetical protein